MAIVRVKYSPEVAERAGRLIDYSGILTSSEKAFLKSVVDFPEGIVATVEPHVQFVCDQIEKEFGYVYFGTYPTHDPSMERAVDGHVAPASYNSDGSRGDAIVNWLLPRMEQWGVDYAIWRPGIWNPPDRAFWRPRPRTGNPTQDHYDHFHLGFLEYKPEYITIKPELPNQPEEIEMDQQTQDAIKHLDTIFDKFCRGISRSAGGPDDGFAGAEILGEFIGGAIKSWKK